MNYSQRVRSLKAEGAYQVLARAQALEAEGRDIIHLEIGEPDFETPSHIQQAGIQAILAGRTRYNLPSGILELRQQVAIAASRQRGVTIDPGQVVITPGAKPDLFFPTLALVEPGDEVLYPDPGFPTYEAMIQVAGGIPLPVPLLEQNGFSFDMEAFDRQLSPHTRLIILNSPGNPTGSVIPLADLQHIARAAQKHDCWVLSDEIYARLVFDGLTAPSIYALPGMAERTIIVDGFSKTYAMTGWRLGFGIMPEALAERVNLLLTHSVGCTAHFTQYAGLAALEGSQQDVYAMVAAYQERRDITVAALNAIPGITCLKPQGAFYAFPNIRAFGLSSAEMANLILEKANVALLPGTAFGGYGEGYLRVVFACSVENIQRAIKRIESALASVKTRI
jgi:aspartate aminotransferase